MCTVGAWHEHLGALGAFPPVQARGDDAIQTHGSHVIMRTLHLDSALRYVASNHAPHGDHRERMGMREWAQETGAELRLVFRIPDRA